jgi:hypothetical protein
LNRIGAAALPLLAAVFFGFAIWSALKTGSLFGNIGSVRRDERPVLFGLGIATYVAMSLVDAALAIAWLCGVIPS